MLKTFPNNDDTDTAMYYSDRICPGSWNKTIVSQKIEQKNSQLYYLSTKNTFFYSLELKVGRE